MDIEDMWQTFFKICVHYISTAQGVVELYKHFKSH